MNFSCRSSHCVRVGTDYDLLSEAAFALETCLGSSKSVLGEADGCNAAPLLVYHYHDHHP